MRGRCPSWIRSLTRDGLGALLLVSVVACGGGGTGPSPVPTPTPAPDRPLPVSGEYTLTMSIAAGCHDQFPASFRVRAYDVTIVPETTHSRLRFADPAILPAPNSACVCGRVSEGRIPLDLTFYEGRAAFNMLYEWHGEAILEASTLRAQVAGRVSLADDSGTAVECTSGEHSVALTPR